MRSQTFSMNATITEQAQRIIGIFEKRHKRPNMVVFFQNLSADYTRGRADYYECHLLLFFYAPELGQFSKLKHVRTLLSKAFLALGNLFQMGQTPSRKRGYEQ